LEAYGRAFENRRRLALGVNYRRG